jgi:hypothetical protein
VLDPEAALAVLLDGADLTTLAPDGQPAPDHEDLV